MPAAPGRLPRAILLPSYAAPPSGEHPARLATAMAEPPPYEDVSFDLNDGKDALRPNDTKNPGPQRLSIREEVGASRSQHVATLVSKILPQIRERAESGLSKTTLLLLPMKGECLMRVNGTLKDTRHDQRSILL